MDERNDSEKIDDVMLPGFRFHPTDEELVGFYLKRKIQQRTLPIELIRQVDIYKFDPWDLPKLAPTGEKEWYFYCPRDRKYRNSARPNRVTGAGFWKATGTDRPIYSSDGTKCIGLKKSLVFYRGRAAKGMKTDWMMHEFRLPTLADSAPPKKFLDKNIPPSDAWAICRIFKKTNSMAQRALSHSWVSPLTESIGTDPFNRGVLCSQFNSENISCSTDIGSTIQLCNNNDIQQASTANFPVIDINSYRPMNLPVSKSPNFSISNGDISTSFMFSPLESGPGKCTSESGSGSMLLAPTLISDLSKASESIDFEGPHQISGFSVALPQDLQGNVTSTEDGEVGFKKNPSAISHGQNLWGVTRSISFPFSLPPSLPDVWKVNMPWESESPPCPSEMSSGFSTNKCYT